MTTYTLNPAELVLAEKAVDIARTQFLEASDLRGDFLSTDTATGLNQGRQIVPPRRLLTMHLYDWEKAHNLARAGQLPPEALGYYRFDAERHYAHQESVFRYYAESGESVERTATPVTCGCTDISNHVSDVQADGHWKCRACGEIWC